MMKNFTSFEPGDVVECLDATRSGGNLEPGRKYVVDGISESGALIRVSGSQDLWGPERFRRAGALADGVIEPGHCGGIRPDHYGGADDPYETIKVLRAWMTREEYIGFCRGNAIKYLSRAGKKDAHLVGKAREDFEKARTYIDFILEEL